MISTLFSKFTLPSPAVSGISRPLIAVVIPMATRLKSRNFKLILANSFNQDSLNHPYFILFVSFFHLFNKFHCSHIIFNGVIKLAELRKVVSLVRI